MAAKVLLIDDEPLVLRALQRTLRRAGHELLTASGGAEALEILEQQDVAVIICDQQMPGMAGAEVLKRSIAIRPDAIRITLTGYADLQATVATVNEGKVSHFLFKPWDDDHLRAIVSEAVRSCEMHREIQRLNDLTRRQRDELQEWSELLEQRVRDRTVALNSSYEQTLSALMLALDAREHATVGHSRRVTIYSLFLALQLGVEFERLEDLYRGALLHDIGKIGTPDAVLLKPGKLDPEERAIIEEHVVIGTRIIEDISYLRDAIAIPRYHHEKYDGTGYAEGLAGDAIPIEARIFAIVDVYDALRNDRPYKKAMPYEKTMQIIHEGDGTHFDPAVVAAFANVPVSTWTSLAAAAEGINNFQEMLVTCLSTQERSSRPRTSEAA